MPTNKSTTYEHWVEATANLQHRRDTTPSVQRGPVINYGELLAKCQIGQSVLDVGCGSQALKNYLPEGVEYCGIDPFPVVPDTKMIAIEDDAARDLKFDTVCAFACLDSVRDLDAALKNMMHIAQKNVIILTGIGIDPDKYHTLRLALGDFYEMFADWKKEFKALMIVDKVYLLEFIKK